MERTLFGFSIGLLIMLSLVPLAQADIIGEVLNLFGLGKTEDPNITTEIKGELTKEYSLSEKTLTIKNGTEEDIKIKLDSPLNTLAKPFDDDTYLIAELSLLSFSSTREKFFDDVKVLRRGNHQTAEKVYTKYLSDKGEWVSFESIKEIPDKVTSIGLFMKGLRAGDTIEWIPIVNEFEVKEWASVTVIITETLSQTDYLTGVSNWMSTTATLDTDYDPVNQLVYTGGNLGKRGYYNRSTNIWYNLSETDEGNFISTNNVYGVSVDTSNGQVYFVGGGGVFGVHNYTAGVTYTLMETDTANWMTTNNVQSVEYAGSIGAVFTGSANGQLGIYNISTNTTSDLSATDSGDWVGTSVVYEMQWDEDRELLWTALGGGKLGYYNISSNVWTDLSTTDAGGWVGTANQLSLELDPTTGMVYTGSVAGDLGRYNLTSNVWNTYFDFNKEVRGLQYDGNGTIYYSGGASGGVPLFGSYNVSANTTTDLSSTARQNFIAGNNQPLNDMTYDVNRSYLYGVGANGQFYYSNKYATPSSAREFFVQRGTLTMSGTTPPQSEVIVNITEVDPTKSFVRVSFRSATSSPSTLKGVGYLISPTELKIDRGTGLSGDSVVNWEVIEGEKLSVQSGAIRGTATSTQSETIFLSSSVNRSNSWIDLMEYSSTTSGSTYPDHMAYPQFINDSAFNTTRKNTGTQVNYGWQVISMEDAVVQEKYAVPSSTPTLTTIDEVNLSRAFLWVADAGTNTTGANQIDIRARAYFINSTTVASQRNGTANNDVQHSFYVIESPNFLVGTGMIELNGVTTPTNGTFGRTANAMNQTFTQFSPSSATSSTAYANTEATILLLNTTHVQMEKGIATGVGYYSYSVIEYIPDDTTPDTSPPTFSDNLTNSTTAGTFIQHNVTISDATAIDTYIFSFDNGTGTFVNDSLVDISGTSYVASVVKYVNETVSSLIRWKVYANDTGGYWNVSETYQYNTTSAVSDTCTYDGSGNWEVACSDNCTINSNVAISSGDLIIYGSNGRFSVNANITGFTKKVKENGCQFIKLNGERA